MLDALLIFAIYTIQDLSIVIFQNFDNNILSPICEVFLVNEPLPNLPPREKEQNLSPLGEIKKGVKTIK
jgi:hypothetical protein